MSAKLFPSHHLLLYSIIFILFLLPTYYAQNDVHYYKCSTPYSCGQNVREIGYPFWGNNRSQFCGLEGFELRCHNNDYTTIEINSQTFRLLSIDQSLRSNSISIARNDIWNNICVDKFRNTTLNESLFSYETDVAFVTLFYDCAPEVNNIPAPNTFVCPINGIDRNGFLVEETTSLVDPCPINMRVPVLRTALQEFNASLTVGELLNRGFNVEYKMSSSPCFECVRSGGLCVSKANSTPTTCLCQDTEYSEACPPKPGSKIIFRVKLVIGIGAALIGILSTCFIICFMRKSSSITSVTFWKWKKNNKDIEAFITQYGSLTPKRYRYSDIQKMTNSFKDELGKGGFGTVYKGKLPDGRFVAIKVLKESKGNGKEFINEVASIGRTSHVNIVSLLGFCYEGQKSALIYEFLPNGSLEKFIYRRSPLNTAHQLGWEKLYEISLGIGRGLEYLHRGCNTRILHLDIKPHNILLDEDFQPKISDFGLAKIYAKKESISSTMEARGTIGYIAPEVFNRNFGVVSHKSDVYSYGMMVLEMVGGRKNIDAEVSDTSKIYFPHWIHEHLEVEKGTIEENETARKMIIVGLWCIQSFPSERPSMSKVVEMLEGSIETLKIPPKPVLSSPPRSTTDSSTLLASYLDTL